MTTNFEPSSISSVVNAKQNATEEPRSERVFVSLMVGPVPSPHLAPSAAFSETLKDSPSLSPKPSRRSQRGWDKRKYHRWRSPILMISFFVVGFALSLAHCIFYPKLKGKVVGNSSSQEEKLRFGTAFSFLTQITLAASVWSVYTQWLWRTVRQKDLTLSVLNAAFEADLSVLSLLNLEMLKKMRLGWVMALFAWSLLLPPFFTPATLSVYKSTNIQEIEQSMPYPAIWDSSMGHKFAYSPPFERGRIQHVDDQSRVFAGPRTNLNLISTATASLGEILPIDAPFNSSTYSTSFYAPIIRCQEANSSTVPLIEKFLEEEMLTATGGNKEVDSAYYSFVPTYDLAGHLTAVAQPRQQSPSNATNELWMTFLRPTLLSNGTRIKERQFHVCTLHNATYDITIMRDHGFQDVTGSYNILEEIYYPRDKNHDVSNMAQHAYTAFMCAISNQLVGKFSWHERTNRTDETQASQFGVIDSQLQRTSLLGSKDLDAFFEFDEVWGLYKDQGLNFNLSDQRLQDKNLARNRTLDVLIEELSFNTTVSLMRNDLFTQSKLVKVLRTDDVNRYSYQPYGLFIPYALANLFTFITVLIGIYSYIYDDVMPGKNFQDIVSAAENPAMVHLVKDRKRSVTVVLVDGKVVLRAGEERTGRVGRRVEVAWRRVTKRKKRMGPGSEKRREAESV